MTNHETILEENKFSAKEDKAHLWSNEEIKLLKAIYSSSICPDDLLKKFPKRNWSGILHKASRLGLKKGGYIPKIRKSRKWTIDEINLVKDFYGQTSDESLQELIPHRSICSIKRMAAKCKPKNKRKKAYFQNPSWSKFENEQLLQNYQTMTTDELSKIITNRTYDAIRAHIRVLKLDRSKEHLYRAMPNFRWTKEEISILTENKDKPIKELRLLLPARTYDSIRCELKRIV